MCACVCACVYACVCVCGTQEKVRVCNIAQCYIIAYKNVVQLTGYMQLCRVVCACARESMDVCDRERESVCVWERVCGRVSHETVSVRESHEKEHECVSYGRYVQ